MASRQPTRFGRINRTRRLRLGLISLGLAMVLASCSLIRRTAARYPAADLDTIYQGSQAGLDRNPVVLIHGFAGATLVRRSDGATAWGAFFTKDSMLPSSPDGLRAMALDIDSLGDTMEHSDLSEIPDDAHAVGLLESVRADARLVDINFKVYAELVEMVEDAGYSPCVEALAAEAASGDGPECFSFFYDWRQDNVGNAIKLGNFLEEARKRVEWRRSRLGSPPQRPIKFDIIAHSMGGLLARYFLRYGARDVLGTADPEITWSGAEHISRTVLISTPNFGAMRVLKEVILGRRYPVVKFEPAMLATWVSAYQLLPRRDHRLWLDDAGYPANVPVDDATFWRRNGWGGFAEDQEEYLGWIFPGEPDLETRKNRLESFMRIAFDRAGRLARALDKHPRSESPVPMILFAADAEPTLARAVLTHRKQAAWLRFGVDKPSLKSPGDGSVTRASALADERLLLGANRPFSSPIRWSQTIFLTDQHRTLLGNPTFQNNLLRILLETDPPA